MKLGRAGHGGLPSPDKPPRTLATVGERERGRSIPFASFRCAAEFDRDRGIADMAGLAGDPIPSRMTRSGSSNQVYAGSGQVISLPFSSLYRRAWDRILPRSD